MQIRRCAIVVLEPREDVAFDLGSLLSGGAGLRRDRRWLALAAHLEAEVELDAAEREALGALSPDAWVEAATAVAAGLGEDTLARLLRAGLVLADDPAVEPGHRGSDDAVRAAHWWPAAAIAHRFGRWQGQDSAAAMEAGQMTTAADIRRKLGPPPPAVVERCPAPQRLALPAPPPGEFERLLARRATCRNFDRDRALPLETFARMLDRVFAAQAQVRVAEDAVFLKKHTPSGGGLHATEAYLLVRAVEGVAPGLYHYHPIERSLEPLPAPPLPLPELALRAVSGQHWFADAPVLAVLAVRYQRSFWKYRRHPKAYRALLLDCGHLSQTLYLSATELELGAFVTSAINEVDIERAFGLDPLHEGPVAVCGFGWRSERMRTAEFDPAGEVWTAASPPS